MENVSKFIERPKFVDLSGQLVNNGDVLIELTGHEYDGGTWNVFKIWQMPWNFHGQGVAYNKNGEPYEFYHCNPRSAFKLLSSDNEKIVINEFMAGDCRIRVKTDYDAKYNSASEIIDTYFSTYKK